MNLILQYWDLEKINLFTLHKCKSLDIVIHQEQGEQFEQDLQYLTINPYLIQLNIRTTSDEINMDVLKLVLKFPFLKKFKFFNLKVPLLDNNNHSASVNKFVNQLLETNIYLEEVSGDDFEWRKNQIKL